MAEVPAVFSRLSSAFRYGIFWSSQLDSLMPWKAWGIYSYHKAVGPATDGRQYGHSVRAVCVP